MSVYSLYIHIPFCRHRCGYCDFNTYAGIESLIPVYVNALCKEIEILGLSSDKKLVVHTIYFGGGTPSLLPVGELEKILKCITKCFALQPGVEITLEANPGTLSFSYLKGLLDVGVNRLSFGVQSINPEDLRLLERHHDSFDVIESVKWARQAGFENVNLDLIFGLPDQSLLRWQQTLIQAVGFKPDHLSLYALSIEQGTLLGAWVDRGFVCVPEPDWTADMYEWASDFLEQNEYLQYEISNWARKIDGGEVKACRHNLQYWRNQPYLGIGAGAHGYANGIRTANVLSPRQYIQSCEIGGGSHFPRTPATTSAVEIDALTEMRETMMMGLRLTNEGVKASDFMARFGKPIEEIFGKEIEELSEMGLLEWGESQNLHLTKRGRLLGNQVFMQFI